MALVPLGWLLVRGERGVEWWWLAGAFGVSWVADTMAHFGNPWVPAAVYPMGQAAMIGTVFLNRRDAQLFVAVLGMVGLLGVLGEGASGPDILLQTVANLGVCGIVWSLPMSRVRVTLLTAFGIGWLAWMGYMLNPGWAGWIAFQLVRMVGLVLFCWASLQPRPMLRVIA